MTCYKCDYEFCWLCGESYYGLIHQEFFSFFFVRCNRRYVQSSINQEYLVLRLIFWLLFMPLGAFILPFMVCIYGSVIVPFEFLKDKADDDCIKYICMCFCITVPLYLLGICLGIVFGVILGALFCLIMTIPMEIIMIYYYYKIWRWWGDSRLVTVSKDKEMKQLSVLPL